MRRDLDADVGAPFLKHVRFFEGAVGADGMGVGPVGVSHRTMRSIGRLPPSAAPPLPFNITNHRQKPL